MTSLTPSSFPTPLSLFDTYKKQLLAVEQSSNGYLSIYSCGPTVYSYQHIGNYRAIWLPDTIARVARLMDIPVRWVMNITDVGHIVGDGDDGENATSGEDKIQVGAKKENKTVEQIINYYTQDFLLQCDRLNYRTPEGMLRPFASEYVKGQMMIALILLKQKKAYLLDDGIYFDSQTMVEYDLPFAIVQEGDNDFTGREIKNTQKSPSDFALWKFVDEASLQKWTFSEFDEVMEILSTIDTSALSPLIEKKSGCPGWHTECVAMILSLFSANGEGTDVSTADLITQAKNTNSVISIHTGGEDHIPIHHKNEILQSTALGFSLASRWVHNKFVTVDGGKMSKSIGNVYRLDDIINKGYDPLSYRMMLMEHHYSQQLDFTWDKLHQSSQRLIGLRKVIAQIKSFISNQGVEFDDNSFDQKQLDILIEPLLDNLNTPLFVQKYEKLSNEVLSTILNQSSIHTKNTSLLFYLDKEFLDLDLWDVVPQSIVDLAEERIESKNNKNYKRADELRDEISSLGYEIGDYSWGYGIWKIR